jgi:hypothetical protein
MFARGTWHPSRFRRSQHAYRVGGELRIKHADADDDEFVRR